MCKKSKIQVLKGCLVGVIPLVVLIAVSLVVLEVLQHIGFHVDGEIPTFVVSKRYPAEMHLPAVQVAVYVDGSVGHGFALEIVSRGEADFPVFGE